MHLEEFAQGRSLLHRLDPRVKLAAAIFWSCMVATSGHLPLPAWALGGALALAVAARLPARKLCARLAFVNAFLVLFWITLPFSLPGETVFSLGPLHASREGFLLALHITLKCNAILLAVTALLGTSTVFALTHALRRLGLPEKLAQIFFFTFRYFQLIHAEYLRLRDAMRARCFTPRANLHSYKSYAQLMGMLLVRSLDRAERVREAMLCRGYDGTLRVFDHFSIQRQEWLFALCFAACCACLLFLT
ncbi:MAG: cobalt ECF transporter T component CbiQ [Deltaproteobacteria bacterium]|nr:cobalt ECF transporter T component CbiQ [Deltaproteobacteria bacterium]